ncbi:MAG: SHOCT domain-containing protein [bacterium]|nr:SHOCT domain-containing protein [bacterium]
MPIFDVLWSMLIFFLFIAWIWVLVSVVADIFRSSDMNGWAKALWMLLVIILPWFGVFVYLIVRGNDMAQRNADDAAAVEDMRRSYIRDAAGTSPADELTKLASLKESGVINAEEYDKLRAKVLG